MHSGTYRRIYDRHARMERLNNRLVAVALILALAVGFTASHRFDTGSFEPGMIDSASQ